jgi:hypothetical protein
MAILEYEPGAAFPGVIGRTAEESAPAWPAPVRARDGAPKRRGDRGLRSRTARAHGPPVGLPTPHETVSSVLRDERRHLPARQWSQARISQQMNRRTLRCAAAGNSRAMKGSEPSHELDYQRRSSAGPWS